MRSGKKTILMVQLASDPLGTAGSVLGNQSEHSHSEENELQDEQTKFGRILGYGNHSESFDITLYVDKKDAGQLAISSAIKNKKQIKLWEIDIDLNATGTHDALFAYCLVENVEKSSPTDGFEEISGTLQVLGSSKDGTLPPLPDSVINFAQYGFEAPGDTTGEYPYPVDAPVLSAGTATVSTVPLTWTEVTGATYNVYQDDVEIATDLAILTHDASGLTASTSYDFEVTAVINGRESAKSNTVTGTTTAT